MDRATKSIDQPKRIIITHEKYYIQQSHEMSHHHHRSRRSLPLFCETRCPPNALSSNDNNNRSLEDDVHDGLSISEIEFRISTLNNNNENDNNSDIFTFPQPFQASLIAAIRNCQKCSAERMPIGPSKGKTNIQDREENIDEPCRKLNLNNNNNFDQNKSRSHAPFGWDISTNAQTPRLARLRNEPLIHDEALKFVESTAKIQEHRSEIYADFIQEYFQCPVCLDILVNPTALSCGHQFCRLCIISWLKYRSTCPICNEYPGHLVRLYESDIAISSVASYLPITWQKRYQTDLKLRKEETEALSASSSALAFTWAQSKVKVLYDHGKRRGSKLWKTTTKKVQRMYKSMVLPQLVLGIMIAIFCSLVIFNTNEIVDYVQYLYISAKNYLMGHPDESMDFGGSSKRKRPKFQKFEGSPNTIFATFIKHFYT